MTIAQSFQAVCELLRHVDEAREARHKECARLLSDLTPRLQAARIVERRLDRHLARRFNVFRYLRDDELGLSRVIADLLDPAGEHGQGTSFLEAMLDALPEACGRFGALRPTATKPIRVMTERWTTTGGRIDITVDIPTATGRFCLAFENKPYAHDLNRQLTRYLDYLRQNYGARFLLIYLPPVHRQPDEISLPQVDRERWRENFTIMPYTGGNTSLAQWFATCRDVCDADAVTWFLGHAELFCQQRFGESTMTTNPDTHFVREHLFDNPSHMRAALAVHDAWQVVRADVCERFLKHLRDAVEAGLRSEEPAGTARDFQVRCRYSREKGRRSVLWVNRQTWLQYDGVPNVRDGRSAVAIQASKGLRPNGWYWGVYSPKPLSKMSETEKERREELDAALKRHGLLLGHDDSDWWPQWEYVSRHQDWVSLAPDLYEECEAGDGPITRYYVDGLLKIARHAIPAIDEVESADRGRSGE